MAKPPWNIEPQRSVCPVAAEGQGSVDEGKTVRLLTRMGSVFSRLSSKSQTVILRGIRERLGLKPGDRVRYSTTLKGIVIDKAEPVSEEGPFAVFSEWSGAADEKAFGKL